MNNNDRALTLKCLLTAALLAAALLSVPAPRVHAQSDDEELEKLQKQMQENQNINEKIGKELEKKGIKLDDPGAVSEAMKKLQGMTGADEESSTSGVYWFFMIFISIVGMGFFSAGKRNEDGWLMASGAVMMVYPYCVSGTFWLVSIGLLLTALPFVMRFYSAGGR